MYAHVASSGDTSSSADEYAKLYDMAKPHTNLAIAILVSHLSCCFLC